MRLRGGFTECGMAKNGRGKYEASYSYDGDVDTGVSSASYPVWMISFRARMACERRPGPLRIRTVIEPADSITTPIPGAATDPDAARFVFRFSQAASMGARPGTGHSPTPLPSIYLPFSIFPCASPSLPFFSIASNNTLSYVPPPSTTQVEPKTRRFGPIARVGGSFSRTSTPPPKTGGTQVALPRTFLPPSDDRQAAPPHPSSGLPGVCHAAERPGGGGAPRTPHV